MESIFGYWFKEYNFGIHMRKHRNQSENYEIILNNQKYKFTYKRNFYGFRGEEIKDLSDIKYVFLGGSTGNERLLPEELTIVGKINSKFKKIILIKFISIMLLLTESHLGDIKMILNFGLQN